MSVLVNGMEMPENCWSCRMFYNCYACEGHYCRCAALDEVIGKDDEVLRNKRRDDCPLVPVQTHGRLIDADALKEIEFHGLQADKKISYQMGWNDAIATIAENATTIIPAEEGET